MTRTPRPSLRTSSRLAALGLLVVLGGTASCSSSDDVLVPPAEIFEFAYEISGSEGSCDTSLRSEGGGVLRITVHSGGTTVCTMQDLCDGEGCWNGVVVGSTFTASGVLGIQEGECTYFVETVYTLTEYPDGHSEGEIRQSLTQGEGAGVDCADMTLPCERSQTFVADPCSPGCYAALCAESTR